jgi:hypothetical protein
MKVRIMKWNRIPRTLGRGLGQRGQNRRLEISGT